MRQTRELGGLTATVDGSGPTLLFLHGIGSSRAAFDAQLDHFAQDHLCVSVDAPGYGDSPDPEPISDMDGWAAVFERLLAELGPGPHAVLGVSFGGVIAARLAIRNKVQLSSLVLADTSRGSGLGPTQALAMRARPDALSELGAATLAEQRAPRLLAPDAPAELVAAVASTMAESVRLPGYAYAAEAMAATDHTELLARISVPTLVVVGELDAVCPPDESQVIAASIPGARYVEIAGAGHLANQEQPELFNAAVAAFLAASDPPINQETEPGHV